MKIEKQELNAKPPKKKTNIWNLQVGGGNKVKEDLIENLSILIIAGLDIKTSLEALNQETTNIRSKDLVEDILYEVSSGSPLWRAITKNKVLPSYMIALLRIGEESGRLKDNMNTIVEQQRKNRQFRSKLLSALMYPALIFFLSVIIGLGLFVFVLPRLTTVYQALRADLPLVTRIIIGFSEFLGNNGAWFIPLVFTLLGFGFYMIFINKNTKQTGQRILFRIPAVKDIVKNVEITRFGFVMGTLLESGLPILDTVVSLERSTEFYAYKDFYKFMLTELQDGNSIQKIFVKYPKINQLFPISVRQSIISAEQSGKLKEALKKIGQIYDEKIDVASKNLTVILEPLLLIIVWVGVVIVALSIIYPIYSLLGGLDSQRKGDVAASPTPTPIVTPDTRNLVKTYSLSEESIDVRDLPDVNGKVIKKINPGGTYRFLKQDGDWFLIVTDEPLQQLGWVFKDNIKKVEFNDSDV